MFCDQADIKVQAGNGGNGVVHWRRELGIPYGGPDGGDGGRGGNVTLRVNENMNTLADFRTQKFFKAEEGEKGGGKQLHGADGKDLILEVPEGTQVSELPSGRLLKDLVKHGDEYLVAKGGRGGFGNTHFKSAVRCSPDFAEKGEPGAEHTIRLDLKLVAEVGIIGIPSVGKSTLIASISNARPKIADYPFTTLIPNLGVVKVGGREFVVADVPGLIEGASEGKGLGHDFLRHIERTKILVHLLDPLREDIVKDYEVINAELQKFDPKIAKKPQVIVINKADTLDKELQEMLVKDFKKRLHLRRKVFVISAVSKAGLKELLYEIKDTLQTFEQKESKAQVEVPTESYKIFRPQLKKMEQRTYIERKKNRFTIHGQRVEQIAVMTDSRSPGAMDRLRDVLRKKGVMRDLVRMGIREGDKIIVGPIEIPYDATLFERR